MINIPTVLQKQNEEFWISHPMNVSMSVCMMYVLMYVRCTHDVNMMYECMFDSLLHRNAVKFLINFTKWGVFGYALNNRLKLSDIARNWLLWMLNVIMWNHGWQNLFAYTYDYSYPQYIHTYARDNHNLFHLALL